MDEVSEGANAPLIAHLERFLGTIVRGYRQREDEAPLPYQLVELAGGLVSFATPFATLGLSDHVVEGGGGVAIHQELLFLRSPKLDRATIPSLLADVADEVLRSGRAALRGRVYGPRGSMFEAYPVWTALYVARPVYVPGDFLPAPHPAGCDVFIPWLIPISTAEARFIRDSGPDAFEDILVRVNPDLVDPERQEVVT